MAADQQQLVADQLASWFASWFATASELDSVIEFGFYCTLR